MQNVYMVIVQCQPHHLRTLVGVDACTSIPVTQKHTTSFMIILVCISKV